MSSRFSFMSKYPHSVDEKGRMALPKDLREELEKSERPDMLVALPGEGGATVVLYPYERWKELEADIRAIQDSGQRELAIETYLGNAERLTLDKAGRLLLPPRFRDMAKLERDVTVIGKLYKMEVRRRQPGDFDSVTKPELNPAIISGLSL
ncbi:MAG: hypothetical protein LBV79_03900 [Candidatus Adiutrix sp.]|jgi:MraZ protein|nr:hypothetical protein [Candidatus Adiutrix sp.]